MRRLAALAALLLLSLLLFIGVFSVVHRPLTLGGVTEAIEARVAYAKGLPSPKLVVWAGSNGRYSHRCEALSAATGLPCVNLSIAMGIGLDFQMHHFEPLLHAGDIVYMPLEYSQYRVERAQMHGGAENPALVRDMPGLLWTLGPRRIATAYGYFDLSYLLHAVLEMGLSKAGVRPRAGSGEGSTEQGDMRGHTAEAAERYRDFVARMAPDSAAVPDDSHALRVYEAFLERQGRRGVTVLGGLPTTPLGSSFDSAFVARLRGMLERHGHHLLRLANASQYPLDCFYDTPYHLHEACQIAHSRAIGEALVTWRSTRPAGVRQP